MNLQQLVNECPPAEQGLDTWRVWVMKVRVFLHDGFSEFVADFEKAVKIRPPMPLVTATVIGGSKSFEEQDRENEEERRRYSEKHYVMRIRSKRPEVLALLEALQSRKSSSSPSVGRVVELLEKLFAANEVKRLVSGLQGGSELIASVLPAESVPKLDFISEVVIALERRGLLNSFFFNEVEKVRPNRTSEIRAVRRNMHPTSDS